MDYLINRLYDYNVMIVIIIIVNNNLYRIELFEVLLYLLNIFGALSV